MPDTSARDRDAAGYDPQKLSFLGKINALIALGRIPLASEVPLWTVLGCVISSRAFPAPSFAWAAMLQCAMVVWGTNISINYGNEYFDWEMDRVSAVAAIKRDMETKKALTAVNVGEILSHDQTMTSKKALNEKIMGNTTRCIHDGTFPPYVALILSAAVQLLVFGMMMYSRSLVSSPFKGVALWIGLLSVFLSHEYVGPPLRLHYNGFGELVSALFLSPVSVLWGLTGYYTATHSEINFKDLLHAPGKGFGIDATLWTMLSAMYCIEQARVLIMHIHDIQADINGGKLTAVVKMGYDRAARLYVGLNVAGVGLWLLACVRLVQGKGMLHGRIWAGGISIVLAYSIPVMVLTANSLFANAPGRQSKPITAIPLIPHMELVKLVSLQLITSPVILSVVAILAN